MARGKKSFNNKERVVRNHEMTTSTQPENVSTQSNQQLWESEGATSDAVFTNLKWKVTSNSDECDQLVSFLISQMDDRRYIGLDAEWDPVFVKGQTSRTALIQLAVHSGYCVIVRVVNMRSLPPLLEKLLTDPSVHKLGVGIQGDVEKIVKDFKVLIRGHFDLRNIAPPAQKRGLGALAADHLGVVMSKSKKLRMSKWSRQLSFAQRAYAAKDAYVAALLLPKFVAMKLKIPVTGVSPNDISNVIEETNKTKNDEKNKEKKNPQKKKWIYMTK